VVCWCGTGGHVPAISASNARLDHELARFARRRLGAACPYLIGGPRYERLRETGEIRSQAVPLAIGIGWDGRRSILAVDLANRENRSSWRDFLLGLRERGSQASSSRFRRPRRPAPGHRRSVARSRLAALLRALPAQHIQRRAAQGRRRLLDRTPRLR
jgi:Transposase, Mutator family